MPAKAKTWVHGSRTWYGLTIVVHQNRDGGWYAGLDGYHTVKNDLMMYMVCGPHRNQKIAEEKLCDFLGKLAAIVLNQQGNR